jgi:dCMP deaminase
MIVIIEFVPSLYYNLIKLIFGGLLMKRNDYISWDEYFMGLALLSAKRSKDPGTQVGACIVSKSNRVLSVGYNGFAFGCSDDEFSWNRTGDFLETKYPYVVHAELNAILNNRGASLEGSKLYVALFPCNECAKAIIQCGIKEIIYLSDKYANTDEVKASKRMLVAAGIKLTQLTPAVNKIEISFDINDI